MATANQNANFVITAKNAASSVFRTIGKDMGGLKSAAGKLTGVLAGLGLSVGALAYAFRNVLGNAIRGAIEEENQLRVLTGLLETRFPKAFQRFTEVMEDQVKVLAELAFADDEVRASFEIATRFTTKAAEATAIQAAAADLARAKGISLADATLLIGKAMKGQTKGLKDLGINLKKGAKLTDILAAVQGKYGTAAEDFADTTQGKFLIAQNNFNESLDTLGTALLPGITTLMEGLEPIISDFAGLIEEKGPEIQAFFKNFATKLKDEWIPKAKEAILEIKQTFDEILDKAEEVFGENGKIAVLLAGLAGIITGKLSGAVTGFLTGLGVDPFVALVVGILAAPAVLAAMTGVANVIAASIIGTRTITGGGGGGGPTIIPTGGGLLGKVKDLGTTLFGILKAPISGLGAAAATAGTALLGLTATGGAGLFNLFDPNQPGSLTGPGGLLSFLNESGNKATTEFQQRLDDLILRGFDKNTAYAAASYFTYLRAGLEPTAEMLAAHYATMLPSYLQGYTGGVPENPNVYVSVTLDGDKVADKVTTRVVNGVRGTTTWRNPQ